MQAIIIILHFCLIKNEIIFLLKPCIDSVDFSPYIYDVDSDISLELTAINYFDITVEIDSFLVSFTPEPNWNGYEEVIFSINDNGTRYVDMDTIKVIINSVNDDPVIGLLDSITIDEDEIYSFTISATDIEEDTLIFNASTGNDNVNATIFEDSCNLFCSPI